MMPTTTSTAGNNAKRLKDQLSIDIYIRVLFDHNFKTLYFADVVFEGYADRYCIPSSIRMAAKTLSDAKKECLESPICHMFVDDRGDGNYYGCENTASIKENLYGSILYQQHGNKIHTRF